MKKDHAGRTDERRAVAHELIELSIQRSLGPQSHIPLQAGIEIGERLLNRLKELPGVQKVDIAGSVRRRKRTIRNIDILVCCHPKFNSTTVDGFLSLPGIRRVLKQGRSEASILIEDHNRRVDLYVVSPDRWGGALLYYTGSMEHIVQLRRIAKDRYLKVNQDGVSLSKTRKLIAGETEEEVYNVLGMDWISPEKREDSDHILAHLR